MNQENAPQEKTSAADMLSPLTPESPTPDSHSEAAFKASHPTQDAKSQPHHAAQEPNAASPKKVLWKGASYSSKAFRLEFFGIFVLTLLCLWLSWRFGGSQIWIWSLLMLVPVLLWIWRLCVCFYRTMTIRYELDDERLLTKNGLLHQTTDTTLIAQINDVKLSQTLWDKLFNGGVGTITLYTSDTTNPELILRCLEHPHDAFEAIDYFRKEYVKRRGIKSFGVGHLGDNFSHDSSDVAISDDPGPN